MHEDGVRTVEALLDRAWLRRTAGWRSWERGVAYAAEGRVGHIQQIPGGIAAAVEGSSTYAARLLVVEQGLSWDCDCPIGEAGELCKHVVALGVASLRDGPAPGPRSTADLPELVRGAPVTMQPDLTSEDVAVWLRGLDAAQLSSMLLDAAAADPDLQAHLTERAAAALSGGHGADGLRLAFDRATRFAVGDRGRPTWAFVEGLADVVGRMEGFLAPGTAHALIDLVEHALAVVEELLDELDDSDGDVGVLVGRLLDLHLAACRLARPEPVMLARRLTGWALRSPWEIFLGFPSRYAEVLGPLGLAEARRVIEPLWSQLPVLVAGDHRAAFAPSGRRGDPSRFVITTLMLDLVDQMGTLDERIAVRARDLHAPGRYLEIAQLCLDAGDEAGAIAWAERAVRDFAGRPGSDVRRFLVGRYQAVGREADALALAWDDFVERPGAETYRRLVTDAARTAAEDEWRAKAMGHAVAQIRPGAGGLPAMSSDDRRPWGDWGTAGASLVVDLLLADGDVDGAWAAATAHGCGRQQWLRLAALREATDPAGSAAVYRCEVDALIEGKNRAHYAEAAKLVVTVRRLLRSSGDVAAGDAYVAALRLEHKRRPSFQDELTRALGRE